MTYRQMIDSSPLFNTIIIVYLSKTVAFLSRLMPNIERSKQRKKQLLMSVVINQLLYTVPVWASILVFDHSIRILQWLQRKMTIKISRAYRTVSINVRLVIAETFLIHLQTSELCAI